MSKFAMDCEMVGSDEKSILARVSIVDVRGNVVLDEYVKPTYPVTDYRTPVSGIRPKDLENAKEFALVKNKVANIITGNILIGHSLHYDLEALRLSHPMVLRRDLARYPPLTNHRGRPQALKKLTRSILNKFIQNNEHDSIEDARACMEIYLKLASTWDKLYK